MIRGIDREVRKAIKDAAKAEGVSVGTWVRRSLVRALRTAAESPASLMDLSEHVRILGARLDVLEKSHRALHEKIKVAGRPAADAASKRRTRWLRTKKSK
jgi:hypothetical protein